MMIAKLELGEGRIKEVLLRNKPIWTVLDIEKNDEVLSYSVQISNYTKNYDGIVVLSFLVQNVDINIGDKINVFENKTTCWTGEINELSLL